MSFTGLTVAASGYVLQTTLLIIAGTLVGASGTILTRLMAEAIGALSCWNFIWRIYGQGKCCVRCSR
jgi:NAD/NADP transhydrogenase beta subunit